MSAGRKNVVINVDRGFFKNLFEVERKKLQKTLGVSLGQQKFTKMIQGFKLKVKPFKTLKRGNGKVTI